MVGSIAFGNGNLAKVKDRGGIVTLGWPKLDEVLYVEGLKENLISISQMCEKDHKLNFHQDLYKVINKKGKVVIIEHRTLDNCYATNSSFRTPLMYSRAKPDSTKLWHKRLGHINYRDLVHLVNTERVRDIPRLSGEPKPICDECMKGKKIKSSHKKVKEIKTTKPLDILHMDLMDPMQTKSKSGKRYVLMVVDNFVKILLCEFS